MDAIRRSLAKHIADMSAETVSPERITKISGYLENWGDVEFEDQRQVLDDIVSLICASSENVNIEWKI